MADIVNLNRYRKLREKAEAESEAAANRVRHGRSKAEREKLKRESEKAAKDLDNKRLD